MQTKIGILGSGQLSQMMVQASRKLDCGIRVLAGSSADPAAQEKGIELAVGPLEPAFFKGLSHVTFESELIDTDLLARTLALSKASVEISPELSSMKLLSEKLEQKKLLGRLGIATSPFEEGPELKTLEPLSIQNEAQAWVKSLQSKWGAFVLKWSKFGYDGRGVMMIANSDRGLEQAAESVCQAWLGRGTQVYAEPLVRFRRELAIVAMRSRVGEFRAYPLVISEQSGGACHWIQGPASAFGIAEKYEKTAREYAEKLSRSLGFSGVFAIEMFETEEGDLWVNEVAPRVHNSGHFTQDSCDHDQFEMHLRCVSGSDSLPELKCASPFLMLNLLGPPGVQGRFPELSQKLPEPPPGSRLHWYGKSEVFPGRKLGHVNQVGDGAFDRTALEEYEEKWIRHLKGLKT